MTKGHAPIACEYDHPSSEWARGWGPYMFSVFKLFENKENTFSYDNKTKTNFKNKENEFTIFNILYIYIRKQFCAVFLVFELNRKHGIL